MQTKNHTKQNSDQSQTELYRDCLKHLNLIYPTKTYSVLTNLMEKLTPLLTKVHNEKTERWTEADVILITYGDSIIDQDKPPLTCLHDFLQKHVKNSVNSVHILPYFSFSSDDGFSVIDYRKVNPTLGQWEHVEKIATDYHLMTDLVINHVSRESLWFSDFIADIPPANQYFIQLPEDTDVKKVTRPRSSPLLVPVNTHRGTLHVWATFSEDQIDLNFENPDVLLELIDIFVFYLSKGSKLIRLDAIAFLWKQLGTTCVHLPQTHEVVKLMRTIMNHLFPDCILLTETNVPHEENLSYYGNHDEAHMVYQFTLPPLLLHALNRGTSDHLTKWAKSLPPLHHDCTFLNFTASHDGIGLRALEGILNKKEINQLIDSMQQFGGFVSMKSNPDGKDTPYEINISLYDALQGSRRGPDQFQIARFICSQAIMLGLQGIPAIYIHSLLGTKNYLHGVELTGRTRSINRKKWPINELTTLLEDTNSEHFEVFTKLKHLLDIRKQTAYFHPSAPQEIIDAGSGLFAILRTLNNNTKKLLAIYNVTAANQVVAISDKPELTDYPKWYDLVSKKELPDILPCTTLRPYQVLWLIEQG